MSGNFKTLTLAAGMGLIAGMRSMAAPALLSHCLSRRVLHRSGRVARFLGSRRTAGVLKILAGGEMVADKTPFVPDRIESPAIGGRAVSGALCGFAIAEVLGGPRWGAALLGSAAAVGSTYAAYTVRKAAGENSSVPDPVLGLAEDAVVLGAGSRLIAAIDH